MAKTFEVEIKFQDREKGPGTVAGKAIVTAGTMAAAIGKGVREILDKTDRKQNFDMQKHGVEILVRSSSEAGEEERSERIGSRSIAAKQTGFPPFSTLREGGQAPHSTHAIIKPPNFKGA